MSYPLVIGVGLAIGIAFCAPVCWRFRIEIKEGWQEILGIIPPGSSAAVTASRELKRERFSLSRRLIALVSLIVFVASFLAFAAVEDEIVRLLCAAVSVLAAAQLGRIYAQAFGTVDRGTAERPSSSLTSSPTTASVHAEMRPPVAWVVAAMFCLGLVIASTLATATGAGVALIAVGIPGALGLLGLGLWMRQRRPRQPS